MFPFSDAQSHRADHSARMRHVAEIAVVGRRRVAPHRVDAHGCASGNRAVSNQTEACAAPPCSTARLRTMRADSIFVPEAALASVLARIIFACVTAPAGRSANLAE